MFARIVVGVLIGLAAAFVFNSKFSVDAKTLQILQGFVAVVAIGFIAASFMFGAVFGLMAVGEIAIGYFAYTKVFQGGSAKS
ncbi:hypothetical protein [Pseudomonas yamanorum]|uniref:Uncharacterized protein n=1 Tax=Pseudomonas yamanorum TaxID=515393 RepID=A0A7Y8FA42_9PSED|nr:hypothetical protein [Pseudomonas yamanorum]NWE75149.1 hypothetical protein [Pseudomonas yamanorum]